MRYFALKKYTLPTLLLAALLLFTSCADRTVSDRNDPIDDVPAFSDDRSEDVDSSNTQNEPTLPEKDSQSSSVDDSPAVAPIVPTVPSADPFNDPLSGSAVTSVVPKNDFSSETIEDFFSNAAFVGDSVMYGFDLYSARNKTLASSSTFLTVTSFAARHALSDVGPKSYHPSYNGEKMKVEDALMLDGANKVFVFLGLNDVRVTPNSYYENYVEFLDNIREKNPNIDIFIVSTTYPVQSPHTMDTPTATSYRNQLQDLNLRLKDYCDQGNAYFVNVVSPLLNQNGFLDDSYSSDSYVHLTNAAYGVWMQTIEDYANTLIATGKAPTVTMPEFSQDAPPVQAPIVEPTASNDAYAEQGSNDAASFDAAASTETVAEQGAPADNSAVQNDQGTFDDVQASYDAADATVQ